MNIDWNSWWPDAALPLSNGASGRYALWIALAVLAAVLVVPTARRWGRTLVTIVHEAGHAGAAGSRASSSRKTSPAMP